jgi:hypothetical protein
VGDLNWDEEYEVDARLQPLEMAKLWKGVYYCQSARGLFPGGMYGLTTRTHRLLDVGQAARPAGARAKPRRLDPRRPPEIKVQERPRRTVPLGDDLPARVLGGHHPRVVHPRSPPVRAPVSFGFPRLSLLTCFGLAQPGQVPALDPTIHACRLQATRAGTVGRARDPRVQRHADRSGRSPRVSAEVLFFPLESLH